MNPGVQITILKILWGKFALLPVQYSHIAQKHPHKMMCTVQYNKCRCSLYFLEKIKSVLLMVCTRESSSHNVHKVGGFYCKVDRQPVLSTNYMNQW